VHRIAFFILLLYFPDLCLVFTHFRRSATSLGVAPSLPAYCLSKEWRLAPSPPFENFPLTPSLSCLWDKAISHPCGPGMGTFFPDTVTLSLWFSFSCCFFRHRSALFGFAHIFYRLSAPFPASSLTTFLLKRPSCPLSFLPHSGI